MCIVSLFLWCPVQIADEASHKILTEKLCVFMDPRHTLELYILLLSHTPELSSKLNLRLSMCGMHDIIEQWKQHGESNIILAIKVAFRKARRTSCYVSLIFFSS